MDKYKIKDLAERLQKEKTTELKNKMLFMWIKQEVISLQEYNELLKLILFGVSQQRELLLAFSKYVNGRIWGDNEPFREDEVDEWIANNCDKSWYKISD